MAQKLAVLSDGTLGVKRMRPLAKNEATPQPAIKLSRLQQLLKSGKPKVCFVRGEGIGDVLMTLPAVHAMKHEFKHIEIHYATNTRYFEGALVKVLENNPDIDRVIDRNDLKETDYDLVINLHCPAIHLETPGARPPNRIDIFANTAGVKIIDPVPRYYITDKEVEKGKEYFSRWHPNDKKIFVHTSASSRRRSLDQTTLFSALSHLNKAHGIRSVILTHPADHDYKDNRWSELPGALVLKNLDIREVAGIMVHCDLVMCPDSALLHLAGALKIPTVSLFGSTDPNARINYYRQAVAIWKGEDYQPCPCWYGSCSIGEICWKAITLSDIVNACVNQIASTNKVDLNNLTPREIGEIFKSEMV